MIGEDRFQEIWEPLNGYFRSIASALKKEFPDLWPVITWHPTGASLFTGYASLLAERDPNRNEDCVLMMQVVHRRDQLVSNCDISSGNGDLFAIGPELSIAAAEPDAAQMEFLRAAERAAEEFFTDNLDEVRRALMAGES